MNVLDQIKRDEGLRLTPYKDTVGKLTIGYGRNLEDVGLLQDEADYLLANDVAKARLFVAESLPWSTSLNEARQAVLINMAFNMGSKLLQFDRTLELIERGDYDLAAAEMLKSRWAGQTKDRAIRLAEQMKSGQFV